MRIDEQFFHGKQNVFEMSDPSGPKERVSE